MSIILEAVAMESCLMPISTTKSPQLFAKPDVVDQILTVGEALVAGSYRSPKKILITCKKVKVGGTHDSRI